MNKDELLKMALEALEEAQAYTSCESFSPSLTNELAICAAQLRQALAQQKLSDSIRPKGKSITKVWVDEINQALEQPKCNPHPDAPHGFNRESSHSLGRYVCDCEGWEPEREWQGLTDEEIAEGARQSWVDKQAFESAVWWAEEKLKEKNL